MKRRTNNRWPTIIIMVIGVVALTVGDLIMSHVMRKLGPLKIESLSLWLEGKAALTTLAGDVYDLLWTIFGQPLVWLAIGFMLIFLVLWMVALSWSDLTFVMPLTALTYVLNAVLVGPFLGETVTPLRWAGTILIAVGVALVSADAGDEPESGAESCSSSTEETGHGSRIHFKDAMNAENHHDV